MGDADYWQKRIEERVAEAMPEWKRTYAEITAAEFDGFAIHRAEILHIGVVALVTGDVREAQRVLEGEYGVVAVVPWRPESNPGLDEQDLFDRAEMQALTAILDEVDRRARGIPGLLEANAIPTEGVVWVRWKEPVPPEVLALEDLEFPGGGWIMVEGARYSHRELGRASHRIQRAYDRGELDVPAFGSGGCADGSGIVVMLMPEDIGDRRAELQDQLSGIARVPVMVTDEGIYYSG